MASEEESPAPAATDNLLPDERELLAAANVATRSEWQWHTSNSWRRLGTPHKDGGIICPTNHPRDRHPDLDVREQDMAYIVAAQPAKVMELLSRISALRAECRDREAAWAKAASGEESAMARVERREDLCIRLARHIRNTDEIPPTSWAVAGMDLLGEVRSLNPRRYDAEVKGPAASRDGENRRKMAEVYVVQRGWQHEGGGVVSIHETLDGAKAAAVAEELIGSVREWKSVEAEAVPGREAERVCGGEYVVVERMAIKP